jgi:pimeloyl-ACP methyl ester carboxylesterase
VSRLFHHWLLVSMLACPAACAPTAATGAGLLTSGDGRQVTTVGGVELTVFTHRPAGCRPRLLLLVFHGTGRNAAAYRDHAARMADQVCAIVVAPEFDRIRFPRALYQYGGTAREAAGMRTIDLVPPLAAWARQAAGQPDLPFVLIGHSAGAQFLGRVAAFVATGAAGIILANPSTWVLPSTTVEAPYGFGGTEAATDAAVRAYLAQPVTVLLGTADTGTRELATSPAAMAQGLNRHARGLNAFHMAQQVADSHGWRFGWTLSEVPGVGHDATAMFISRQALEAIRRLVPTNSQ